MKTKVRYLRQEMGISQQDLAKKVNVARQTISALEHGRYNPSLILAYQITKILKQEKIEDVFLLDEEEEIDTKKLLQLSILYIFGFLIIPLLIAEGYYYRIQQQSLKGVINFIEPLPEFNNYTNLLSNGFRVILTKLFYIIPCVLVLIIGILVGALGISFYLFILFTILLWLVIFFLFLISTPHMVYNNGDVIKTLNIMEIINIIKSIGVKTYLELYIDILIIFTGITTLTTFIILIVSMGVGIVSGQIMGLFWNSNIFTLTFIGLTYILTSIITAYYQIFLARSISSLYNLRED